MVLNTALTYWGVRSKYSSGRQRLLFTTVMVVLKLYNSKPEKIISTFLVLDWQMAVYFFEWSIESEVFSISSNTPLALSNLIKVGINCIIYIVLRVSLF